jgi:biotin carboxyl carrier protein
MRYIATVNDKVYEIEVNSEREITVDGARRVVDMLPVSAQPLYSLIVDGRSYEAYVYENEMSLEVVLDGRQYQVTVEDERKHRLPQASAGTEVRRDDFHLKAPMPGLVVAVPVEEGQEVKRGDDLVMLESMKMQNELKAPRPGIITQVKVRPGDRVEQNQVLLILG